jgi:hypothetical protein
MIANENEALLSGSGIPPQGDVGSSNDPKKVLYKCRKIAQLQFIYFTVHKKCTAAFSLHNCK